LVIGVSIALAGFGGWRTGWSEAIGRIIQAPTTETPTETTASTIKVITRETVVDVTVTDKNGNPVHGLTQADFTVKEDRKEQPIRSFHEYRNQPTDSGSQPAPARLPPNTYSNRQQTPPSNVTNILLLDFVNTAAIPALEVLGGEDAFGRALASQKAVKQAAIQYVSTMPAGTRVIALGFSNSLRMLQGATSDSALLSAAINTMDYNAEGKAGDTNQFCMQIEQRSRMTLEALDQIAADSVTVKGKKNLLWFSVGMPWLTDPNARAGCLPDYFNDLLKTYDLLASAQIAIYPIDVRGVPTPPQSFFTSQGQLVTAQPAAQNQLAFQRVTAEQQLSMESIAEATGGAAYYNSNDLASLIAKAIDKGSNYYTLSYIPPGTKYDNGHHSIKVSIDQSGLHLVYRNSYDAVDPATINPAPGLTLTTIAPDAAGGNMRAAMSRSMPTSAQLLFDVRVEPDTTRAQPGAPTVMGALAPAVKEKLNGNPLSRYRFLYSIAPHQIAFADGPDGLYHGTLEVDIAAYDADAKLVTSLSQTVKIPLNDFDLQQFMQQDLRISQQIDLPSGQLFIRIGVLDQTSHKLGTLEIPLTVAKEVHK
jgi:VWFA-related protein